MVVQNGSQFTVVARIRLFSGTIFIILFVHRCGPKMYRPCIKDENGSDYKGNGVHNSEGFYLKSFTKHFLWQLSINFNWTHIIVQRISINWVHKNKYDQEVQDLL